MNAYAVFPLFDVKFTELNQFILALVNEYKDGKLMSWDQLDERVKTFFSPVNMDVIESKAPGWKKMASYSEGITLTHVMCVFLGMFMLPEFRTLSADQKQFAKWIILFHDIDKFHIRGIRDTMHAFRSGVVAANTMPRLGFSVTDQFDALIQEWSELTINAFILDKSDSTPKPDNQQLPKILTGIDQLFGQDTPAELIIKTVLLHVSLDVDKNYPTPSPLTESEIRAYINPSLLSLLKVMMLADNEGWSLFEPEIRDQQNRDAIQAFKRIEELIS